MGTHHPFSASKTGFMSNFADWQKFSGSAGDISCNGISVVARCVVTEPFQELGGSRRVDCLAFSRLLRVAKAFF